MQRIDEVFNQTLSLKDLSDKNIRYEQIGNVIYMMANPTRLHEAVIFAVMGQLWNYLHDKPCKAYGSNLGLDLKKFIPALKALPYLENYFKEKTEKIKDEQVYLLPDISVICDKDESNYGAHGYKSAPKLIIEVYSPSTGAKDFGEKKDIYETIGVSEYWIIQDPQNVVVYTLKDGKYLKTEYHTENDILDVPVSVFPDLVITFDKNTL